MASANDKNTFLITRTFKASQDLLFKVWTDPKHIQNWMSPKGFKSSYKKADIRPGGRYHYSMTTPDGLEMWGMLEYQEVQSPKKLVYAQWFSDANEGVGRHPMSATWPLKMLTTIHFEPIGPKETKLTLTWTPIEGTHEEMETFIKSMSGMEQGWGGTFEKLTEYLAELMQG